MIKSILTGVISALTLISIAGPSNAAQDRPNILLIVAEDMSPRIGALGDPVAVTPNIDKLAEQASIYPHMFTAAGVCAPSRAALITGRYQTTINAQHMRTRDPVPFLVSGGPVQYDAVPPAEVKAFPEILRAAGYYTFNTRKTDYQIGNPFTIWDENGMDPDWSGRTDPDQPFFGMVNPQASHESGLFDEENWFRSFGNFMTVAVRRLMFGEVEKVVSPDDVTVPPYYPDTPKVREGIAQQYNIIARMDQTVGEWIKRLEDAGLRDNTIIIFTTDHGDGLPRAKRTLYDSGILVPFMIVWPDGMKPANEQTHQLHSFIDIAPTLLELAGVDRPDWMQGRSILSGAPRDFIYAQGDRFDAQMDRVRAVRDFNYKLIVNEFPELPAMLPIAFRMNLPMMEDLSPPRPREELPREMWNSLGDQRDPVELYDLRTDPHEVNNLADSAALVEVRQRLMKALTDWRAQIDDTQFDELEMIEAQWPGLEQPVTATPQILADGDATHITCETGGASIGYRFAEDDEDHWRLYTGPIPLSAGQVVEAKAIRYGYAESEIATLAD